MPWCISVQIPQGTVLAARRAAIQDCVDVALAAVANPPAAADDDIDNDDDDDDDDDDAMFLGPRGSPTKPPRPAAAHPDRSLLAAATHDLRKGPPPAAAQAQQADTYTTLAAVPVKNVLVKNQQVRIYTVHATLTHISCAAKVGL